MHTKEAYPTFSIVIPTYNRPDRLETCLESLFQLEYPFNRFEVIVVDNGSPVALKPVVEPFRGPLDLRFHRQENAGPAAARNARARQAQGTFLVFALV